MDDCKITERLCPSKENIQTIEIFLKEKWFKKPEDKENSSKQLGKKVKNSPSRKFAFLVHFS